MFASVEMWRLHEGDPGRRYWLVFGPSQSSVPGRKDILKSSPLGSEDLIIYPDCAVHLITHFAINNERVKSVAQGTGDEGGLLEMVP